MRTATAFDDYREMLGDSVRMDAYRRAIADVVRPGDVVIDLGAGTGILGFLALQAGASRIHLIEHRDAIELARAVAAHNGWTDRVIFHHQSSFDVELEERADVLLTETLGSFGVDENTLSATLDARKRLLKHDARLIPQRLELWLAPAESAAAKRERDTFWRNISGIDFSPAAEILLGRMGIIDLSESDFLARPAAVTEIDLSTFSDPSLEIRRRFVFFRWGRVSGFAGWFRAHLTPDLTIDTSPKAPATHWKQAWLPLRETVPVGPSDFLDLSLSVTPSTTQVAVTQIEWSWLSSQVELSDADRENLSCPCGTGRRAGRCCARVKSRLAHPSISDSRASSFSR